MGEAAALTTTFDTAQQLVRILPEEGYNLRAAVWTLKGEDRWTLLLVPAHPFEGNLKETVKVAYVISKRRDELPGRHNLQFEVVEESDPTITAVTEVSRTLRHAPREFEGLHHGSTYVEKAYVLKAA